MNKIIGPQVDFIQEKAFINLVGTTLESSGKFHDKVSNSPLFTMVDEGNLLSPTKVQRQSNVANKRAEFVGKDTEMSSVIKSTAFETKTRLTLPSSLLKGSWTKGKFNSVLKEFAKIHKVQLAIKKFIGFSSLKKLENFNEVHFNLINDLSHVDAYETQIEIRMMKEKKLAKKIKSKILKYLKKLMSKIPLVKSDSKFKIIWDIIILLLIIMFCFEFSVEISFDLVYSGSLVVFFKVVGFLLFICDILIKTHTTFYEYGICVKDEKKILQNYVKTMLFYDAISVVAYLFSFLSSEARFFKIFFLFSYNNIRTIYKNLKEQWKTGDFFELILLLCRLVCVCHFLACIWHAIGYYTTQDGENSWIENYSNFDWGNRYLISMYWSITTLCTVGYGDITPKNSIEILYASLVMLLGTLMFGYNINCIGVLINKIEEKGKELSDKINIVDSYLDKSNINETLKLKVKKYLQYICNTEDKNFEKGQELINKLPANIKDEIFLESIGKFLKGFPILIKNFSEDFVEKIALELKPTRYSPCDVIYKQGETEGKALYFIADGEIDLICETQTTSEKKREVLIKSLKKGDVFGEISFFGGDIFYETSRSRSYSTVYKLTIEEFQKKVASFPDDLEKFYMIRDKLNCNKEFKDLYISCPLCKANNHFMKNCPYVNISSISNQSLIFNKLLYSKPQTRCLFLRKNNISIKSLKDRKMYMKKAIDIRFNKTLLKNYFRNLNKNSNIDSPDMIASTLLDQEANPFLRNFSGELDREKETFDTRKYKSLDFVPLFNNEKKLKSVSFEILPTIKRKESHSRISQKTRTSKTSSYHQKTNDGDCFEKKKNISFNNEISEEYINISNFLHRNTIYEPTPDKKHPEINASLRDDGSPKMKRMNSYLSKYTKINRNTSFIYQGSLKTKPKLDPKYMFWGDFERIKEYKEYFKTKNADNIIKEYEKRKSKSSCKIRGTKKNI